MLTIPSPFHFTGRAGYAPCYIVLHGTAGGSSAQNIAEWFTNPQAQVSTNYVIGQDGTVVCCVPDEDAAWGNGALSAGHDPWWSEAINPNFLSISIEHVKPSSDNSNQLTEAQQQASFSLIADLCARHGIPARRADSTGGICGHNSIDPVNRAECPGSYPWEALFAFLNNSSLPQEEITTVLQIEQVSDYFQEVEKDQRWHCPKTNQDLAYGILAFYRTFGQVGLNGFSIFGLPRSGEVHIPGKQSVTLQLFERGAILYDPSGEVDRVPGLPGPCYPAHIDQGEGLHLLLSEFAPAAPTSSPTMAQNVEAATTTLSSIQSAAQAILVAVQHIQSDLVEAR